MKALPPLRRLALRCLAAACLLSLGVHASHAATAAKPAALPYIAFNHGAHQLIVDGRPFAIIGGELNNSSASSAAYMQAVWPKLKTMGLNTVLAPVYWEAIEPKEGKFDFSSVDRMILDARKNGMRLVLLWFGSWKNSMSCYVPEWVKRDSARFPRAQRSDGSGIEILSAFSADNLEADGRAFAALMQHLRSVDGTRHTVVMVQPENEVGMIPEARDHSPAAEAAFAGPVPAALTHYLIEHKDTLAPALKAAWEAHGSKLGASWAETFGESPATDELFTAWTEALYTGKVAARGKAVYPLPMFANAALVRPGKLPGQYPSGGPLPHLYDIWRAAAPALDFLSPDLYFPNFQEWARQYARPDNPMFIPETGRVSAAEMGANAFWAFATLNAMGFSPYAPEFLDTDETKILGEAYSVLHQMMPAILDAQGTRQIVGIRPPVAFDGTADLSAQQFVLGEYRFDVRFKMPPPISTGATEETELPGAHGGLIVQTGPDEFLVAGTGMIVFFTTSNSDDGIAGIAAIDEGEFVKGKWVPGRRLNGDETNQGRQLQVPTGHFTIHRVRLYRYR